MMPALVASPVDGGSDLRDGEIRSISESCNCRAQAAQANWSATTLAVRLAMIRRVRHLIADHATMLAESVPLSAPSSLHRNLADTLVAEVLPLAEACRFLERNAGALLRVRKLGGNGRPVWLRGVQSEVQRVPLGTVLLIAPSNYPLFLPGVQALQALVAGNCVLWKPAAAGAASARAFANLLVMAGLPQDVLQVLDASVESGIDAIREGVDKVFVTGHADTGRAVMRETAATLTPSVMELSGCDAVFILPGADLQRVARALAFGLRLNGSATCMAPRRVFASLPQTQELMPQLLPLLKDITPAALSAKAGVQLDDMIRDAELRGATVVRDGRQGPMATPIVFTGVTPEAVMMRTDIFAPLLGFCDVDGAAAALRAYGQCPYALTAAVFGPDEEATVFASKVRAGTVLINDLIVSTADPRVPFGGRGASGFGSTRGREGLLEMTAVKTIIQQKSRSLRPYATTGKDHVAFFRSFIEMMHSASIAARLNAARRLVPAARRVEKHLHQQGK